MTKKEIAEWLHSNFCEWGHEDGNRCMWTWEIEYEKFPQGVSKPVDRWTGKAHTKWLLLAGQLLRKMK